MEYITKNEIAVDNLNNALAIQEVLLNNNYIVMISKEESLYIVNYIWSEYCDRNDVVFQDREIFTCNNLMAVTDNDL